MLLLVCLAVLAAPVQRPTDVVKWSATPSSSTVTPGSVVGVSVTATVQPGWKLYAIEQPANGPRPLTFAMRKGAAFEIVSKKIGAPKSKVQKQDANFAIDTRYYENEAVFTVPVTIPRSTPVGSHELPLEVTFQACGAELCLRPFTQALPVKVSITQ